MKSNETRKSRKMKATLETKSCTKMKNHSPLNCPRPCKNLCGKTQVNLGHPSRKRFLRILRAAGARLDVLSHVRHQFQCAFCSSMSHVRIRQHRGRGRGQELSILNVVDHRTDFQLCFRLSDRTALETCATEVLSSRESSNEVSSNGAFFNMCFQTTQSIRMVGSRDTVAG